MELGVNLGYFGMGVDQDNVAVAQEADRLGYAVAWAAEAYGSDVPTVLSWIGALTERIDLGAAVMQIPARTPAMTAMTAATLDTLSEGRFRLGLGRQRTAGERGLARRAVRRAARPHPRVRRHRPDGAAARRPWPTTGRHFTLPLPDGPGKALKLTVHPPRQHLPIYLAAVGPKNLELAGEVADGWHAIFFSPEHSGDLVAVRGRGPPGRRRSTDDDPLAGFDIAASVPVVIADDVRGRRRRDPALRRALHRRHGLAGAELLQPAGLRMGFEEAAAAGAGPLPRPAAPGRRGCRAVRVHRRHGPHRPP